MNIFILFSKDANWSKVTIKTFIMLQKISICQINAVLLNFLFIKESWNKCMMVDTSF